MRYRVHGDNRSALLADPQRFARQIERACQRDLFARDVSGRGSATGVGHDIRGLRRGRHLLQMRVAERRMLAGDPPIPGDGRAMMIRDSIMNIFAPGSETVAYRLAISLWCVATLIAPDRIAARLIGWRFA